MLWEAFRYSLLWSDYWSSFLKTSQLIYPSIYPFSAVLLGDQSQGATLVQPTGGCPEQGHAECREVIADWWSICQKVIRSIVCSVGPSTLPAQKPSLKFEGCLRLFNMRTIWHTDRWLHFLTITVQTHHIYTIYIWMGISSRIVFAWCCIPISMQLKCT